MIKRILLFLALNFAALAIGGLFTGSGVTSDWYTSLNQAPWTPPGWVFGAAWTTIMICFAMFMAYAYEKVAAKRPLIAAYAVQWILNVSWNPIFFEFRQVTLGLITITSLTILVGYIFFKYYKTLQVKSLVILPYLVWLCVATSLNAFILINN